MITKSFRQSINAVLYFELCFVSGPSYINYDICHSSSDAYRNFIKKVSPYNIKIFFVKKVYTSELLTASEEMRDKESFSAWNNKKQEGGKNHKHVEIVFGLGRNYSPFSCFFSCCWAHSRNTRMHVSLRRKNSPSRALLLQVKLAFEVSKMTCKNCFEFSCRGRKVKQIPHPDGSSLREIYRSQFNWMH